MTATESYENILKSLGINEELPDRLQSTYLKKIAEAVRGIDTPTDEQIQTAVNALAEAHPEMFCGVTEEEVDEKIDDVKSEFYSDYVAKDNVKTINGQSILGSGNIEIQGGGSVDVLSGKKVLCIGDSICEGVGTLGGNQSYAYYLQQLHPNASIVNLGVGGMTISQKDSSVTNCMPTRIQSGEFNEISGVDIILFEGGVNDMMRNVKLGEISKGYSANKYVRFCDALEYMFKYFKTKFPNARMIFTSIHKLTSMDVNLQNAWWELTSEVCAKWGIEYIDLYSLVNANVVSGLDLHPTETVHQNLYTPILDDVLCGSRSFASKDTDFYLRNRVATIFYHSGTKTFEVGATVSTSDWRINGYRTDLTTYINATSGCTFDISDVDNTQAGTYQAHVSYVDNGRTLYCDVPITITSSAEKVLDSITATKAATSGQVGASISTSDITVTAHYTDSTTANVTSSATIDTSNVNTALQGEYSILISYTLNGITCNTSIAYSVTDSPVPSGNWDDEITLERAWQTDQFFTNSIGNFDQGTDYNLKFTGIVESSGSISGSLIFKLMNGQTKTIGTVTNEQFDVDWDFTHSGQNAHNATMLAYTTGGSGFPWTVKIKDVVLTAK